MKPTHVVKRSETSTFMYVLQSNTSHSSLVLMSFQSGNLQLSIQAAPHHTCVFIMRVVSSETSVFSQFSSCQISCLPISTEDESTGNYSHFPAAACGTNA